MKDSVGAPTRLWALQSKTHSGLIIQNKICFFFVFATGLAAEGDYGTFSLEDSRPLETALLFHRSASDNASVEMWLCLNRQN